MNNLQFQKTTPSNPKYLLNEIKNTHTNTQRRPEMDGMRWPKENEKKNNTKKTIALEM